MVANTINLSPLITAIPERLSISLETRHQFHKKDFLNLIHEKYLFHYRFKTNNRKKINKERTEQLKKLKNSN